MKGKLILLGAYVALFPTVFFWEAWREGDVVGFRFQNIEFGSNDVKVGSVDFGRWDLDKCFAEEK